MATNAAISSAASSDVNYTGLAGEKKLRNEVGQTYDRFPVVGIRKPNSNWLINEEDVGIRIPGLWMLYWSTGVWNSAWSCGNKS
jgi:hypothetical protein